MVCDGTRVVDAEGVEGVGERSLGSDCVLGFLECKVCYRCRLGVGTSLGREESYIVYKSVSTFSEQQNMDHSTWDKRM